MLHMLCHDDKCQLCIGEKSIETSDAQIKELRMHGKVYRIMAPRHGSGKGKVFHEIFQDITEQKRLEEQNRKHYEKLKGDIEFAKQIQRKALPEDRVY